MKEHQIKTIEIAPVAWVNNDRAEIKDDQWAETISTIVLDEQFDVSAFDGVQEFSHLQVIFYFHKTDKVVSTSAHPRGNINWPKVGIFAQRKKSRPNHIGSTIVELLKRHGRTLTVRYLDAIDGTPILDIKPVMNEFMPRKEIRQPEWSMALMANYWE